jgi:arginine exporter protein ArgO
MGIGAALIAGIIAGLALAVPLGAIGVLLLREGAVHGTRRALSAAAGVATVDVVYCTLAVTVGAFASPIIARWSPWPALLGGGVLVVMGVIGIVRTLRRPPAAADPSAPAGHAGRYAKFIGLTLVNPATLIVFVAIIAGLDGRIDTVAAAAAFVIGVGAASLGWGSLLVAAGGVLHARSSPRIQRLTGVAGSLIVAVLGVALVVGALG